MNAPANNGVASLKADGSAPKCIVCGDPVLDRCFCRINREQGGPILLCCPSCAIQYLESARVPASTQEEEFSAREKSVHLFIGEDKPWL